MRAHFEVGSPEVARGVMEEVNGPSQLLGAPPQLGHGSKVLVRNPGVQQLGRQRLDLRQRQAACCDSLHSYHGHAPNGVPRPKPDFTSISGSEGEVAAGAGGDTCEHSAPPTHAPCSEYF